MPVSTDADERADASRRSLQTALALLAVGATFLALAGGRDVVRGSSPSLLMFLPAVMVIVGLAQQRRVSPEDLPAPQNYWPAYVWLSAAALIAPAACLVLEPAPLWLAFIGWFGVASLLIGVFEAMGQPQWGAITPWGWRSR